MEREAVASKFEAFTSAVEEIQSTLRNKNITIDKDSAFQEEEKEFIKDLIKSKDYDLMPHLMRPFEKVSFDTEGGLLIDENERFLYSLFEGVEEEIPYRCHPYFFKTNKAVYLDGDEDNFYLSGTTYEALKNRWNDLSNSEFYELYATRDIYQIRQLLCQFELKKELPFLDENEKTPSTSIIIIPNWKDDHATLTLHILDLDSSRVLTSIFLNSWHSPDYFQYISQRFYNSSKYQYFIEDVEDFKTRFSPDILQKVNPSAEKKRIKCDWVIPFYDCSFNLQTEKNDKNCALYGYSYAQGITQLLGDAKVRDEIVSAGRKLFINVRDAQAIDVLNDIFKKRIQGYLPQYYSASQTPRTVEEIKDYHMRLRWTLSSEFLKKFFEK